MLRLISLLFFVIIAGCSTKTQKLEKQKLADIYVKKSEYALDSHDV